MTDNKTIKALECCINKYNSCESCPLFEYGDSKACQNKLQADVLDLINRQKAEIERLRKRQKPTASSGYKVENGKIVFFTNMLGGYRHEYETLDEIAKELNALLQESYDKQDISMHFHDLHNKYIEAKSEAIKEFAERLRNEIINKPSEFTADKGTVDFLNGLAHRQNEILDNIDNLVKEMVGEG